MTEGLAVEEAAALHQACDVDVDGSPQVEDTDRALLEQQTGRNLRGLELERAGRGDEAAVLYEQNLAEGFAGDWPYGRLVSYYSARGQLEDVVRVLERGIAVLEQSPTRTRSDRRALQQVFRRRLREARKALTDQEKQARPAASSDDEGEGGPRARSLKRSPRGA